MPTLLQFGAGNIGRSFIGQLFSRAGYEVVFVDINRTVIAALNERRAYRLVIKRNDLPDEVIPIKSVRGVLASDAAAVAEEFAAADIAATAVGQNALPHIFPLIAAGLLLRRQKGGGPMDILLAENLRNAAAFVRAGLAPLLPPAFDASALGLVETSIGKMVPIMREEDLQKDPVWVFAEEYNNLIVDRRAFRNPVPSIDGLSPKDNMAAYVDRKLFIHNLGHAVAAYIGFVENPHLTCVWQLLELPSVVSAVRSAMRESAAALVKEYPKEFTTAGLSDHIEDLISRFRNRSLGDTVFRLGRDLRRKLGKEDRLVGAVLLAIKHGIPCPSIIRAIHAALRFRATDEHGRALEDDTRLLEQEVPKGMRHILTDVSGLSPLVETEKRAIDAICRREP